MIVEAPLLLQPLHPIGSNKPISNILRCNFINRRKLRLAVVVHWLMVVV